MKKRLAPAVMTIGVLAYILAVSQRSSMGVAALDATERFHTNAEQLATLAAAQLFVYAAMQIPVGILLDRFGPRVLLTAGAAAMAVGQFIVAFSTELGWAITGRMFVGFGDAFTFISMIRLINGWYVGKKASQLQQWMGNGGQLGQIVSAVPFAFLLHQTSWQSAFTTMAATSALIAVCVFFVVHDDREPMEHSNGVTLRTALRNLREQVALPSTKMSFWIHFSTMSASSMFILLWGIPYMVSAQGLERPLALGLLSSFVFIGFASGLVFAQICGHRPDWRHRTLVIMILSILGSWGFMLLWPDHVPLWVLMVMVFCLGSAGPSSMIAFDYSKEFVPKEKLGATNGFINIGGFSAIFIMMWLIGLVLDGYYLLFNTVEHPQPLYSIDGFRVAFCVVLLVVGFGLWRYLANARLVRQASVDKN
mgnify:CR=1 FL=1